MEYRDFNCLRLSSNALARYNQLSPKEREMTMPELLEDTRKYFGFVHPINRLVEMGELNFDADSSLEEIVKILRRWDDKLPKKG